jgi:ketosteroid isomerase-like protein
MQMKKIILSLVSIVLLATSFTSCTNFGNSVLLMADKAAISKATTDINQAFNASKDYITNGNAVYTEDAAVFYPNSEAIKGHHPIIASFSLFESTMKVFPGIRDINGKDDLAYMYSSVKIETDPGVKLDQGKYLEIRKIKNDHKWQVTYDIYNTSIPMAADTTKSNK